MKINDEGEPTKWKHFLEQTGKKRNSSCKSESLKVQIKIVDTFAADQSSQILKDEGRKYQLD